MHTLPQTLATGWIETGTNLGTEFKTFLLYIVIPIIALIGVILTWWKTHSTPAAIVALIMGCAVWWGALHMDMLRDKTGDDINRSNTISTTSGAGTANGGPLGTGAR
ncbi:hypothetical protein [Streptomyces sp. H39-C1]|uniref:hypothetical protein n=1 Tax=Streptomyces sp. H39-C1 TaxID=3004355 RepID=UPI0022AF5A20|nr:hypothetical protein [Streptomyces sp. H39-C1]MCZ4098083.1 hypothetical protein [Streptomyces sp. H39-C1]